MAHLSSSSGWAASAYRSWLETERVAPGAETAAFIATANPNDPLQQLYVAVLEGGAGRWRAAAAALLAAFRSSDCAVLESAQANLMREICGFDGYAFFDDGSDDPDVRDMTDEEALNKLEATLAAHATGAFGGVTACESEHADARSSKRARMETGGVAATPPGAPVAAACAWMRHWLYQRESGRWKEARVQVRLQKLLFFADALHMYETGSSMFMLAPHAFANGPVYPEARDLLKRLQAERRPATYLPPDTEAVLGARAVSYMQRVANALGRVDTEVLIELTHSARPWTRAVRRAHRTKEKFVPLALQDMQEWFRGDGSVLPRAIQLAEAGDSHELDDLLAMMKLRCEAVASTQVDTYDSDDA